MTIPLEQPTEASQQLCNNSYTLAQEYIEWRLQEGSASLMDVNDLAQTLPLGIANAILYSGGLLSDEELYTFPDEVYGQCIEMWNESRKFTVTF